MESSESQEFFDAVEFISPQEQIKQPSFQLPNQMPSVFKLQPSFKEAQFKTTSPMVSFTPTSSVRDSQKFPTPEWFSVPILSHKQNPQFKLRLVQDIPLVYREVSKYWLLSFSPDNRFLVLANDRGTLPIFQVASRPDSSQFIRPNPLRTLTAHSDAITSISWSQQQFLTSSLDKTVRLWNTQSETPLQCFPHPFQVLAVSFHPVHSEYLVTGAADKLIRIFRISSKKHEGLYQLPNHISCLQYSPTGEMLAVGLVKGLIVVYKHSEDDFKLRMSNIVKSRNRRGFKSGGRKVTSIQFFTNQTILVSSLDSRMRLLDIKTGNMIVKFKGHKNSVFPVIPSISHDNNYILSGSENGRIFLWKYETDHKKNKRSESYQVRNKRTVQFAVFASRELVDQVRASCMLIQNMEPVHILVSAGSKDSLRVFYSLD